MTETSVKTIQVENPQNRPMHYGVDHVIGAVYAPDYTPKYRLYSYAEGEHRYNEMQHDLYQNSKKTHPKEKEFPTIFKTIVIGAVSVCAIFGLKKGITKIINKFKK